MRYSKVYIESFGYELAPNIVTSDDLEKRLEPLYETLHFQKGQLEVITGISERRFWDPGYKMKASLDIFMKYYKYLLHSDFEPQQLLRP